MAAKQGNTPKEKCSLTKNGRTMLPRSNQSVEAEPKQKLLPSGRRPISYECEICFNAFTSREHLKRHLVRFENLKYPCNECGTKFSSSARLRSHVAYTHSICAPKYQLQCPVCKQGINAESHLQSHLCHYHRGWEDMSIFASETCPDETETSSLVENQQSNQTVASEQSRKQRTIRLVKNLARKMLGEKKEGPSVNRKPFFEMLKQRMSKELKALLTDVDVRERGRKRKETDDLQNCELLKRNRRTRFSGNNRQKNLSDGYESNPNEVASASKGVRKKARQQSSKVVSTYARDASLRALYSCKECYVPLSRINVTKNMLTTLAKRDKERRSVSLEKSTHRADDSESEKSRSNNSKRLERASSSELRLIDLQARLQKFSNSEIFIKSETGSYESYGPSSVFIDALEECFDPLGSPHDTQEDNSEVDESSREMIDSFVEYPLSLEFPFKTEVATHDAGEIPEIGTESLAQCHDSPVFPIKAEPMDCEDDGHSTTKKETFAECPLSPKLSDNAETANFRVNESSEKLTGTFVECADASSTAIKVEPDDHTVNEYQSNCPAEDDAELPRTPDKSVTQVTRQDSTLNALVPQDKCDTSYTIVPPEKTTEVPQGRLMVSSRICDRLFTSRRTMLRHFRSKHLTRFNESVYCVCGKEMIGRTTMDKHFTRHCDTVIKTSKAASCMDTPCKPLEKKFMCAKCGEKFWLETCLCDHPPQCESSNVEPVKQNRLTNNLHKAFGVVNDIGDGVEYICRVCNVKFVSVEMLLRHVRTFTTSKKYPCTICRTVFTGIRMLKGHIQSTHENSSTIFYKYFCNFCNQGFTKKVYKRIHTMHIHTNEALKAIEGSNESYRSAINGSAPADDNPENRCEICNLVFVTRKRFVDHVSYYDKNERFCCNICGEIFEGQYSAHNHRKKVHYDGKVKNAYTHCCAICNEGFTYKTHLHAHMFHVHNKEFNCATSLKDCKASEENGSSVEGDFLCDRCSKRFLTDSQLMAHLNSRHQDDTMSCVVKSSRCDKELATSSNWKFDFKNADFGETNDPPDFCFMNPTSNDFTFVEDSTSSERIADSGDTIHALPKRSETHRESSPDSESLDGDILNPANDAGRLTRCSTCGVDCPGRWGLAKHKAMYNNAGIYVCEFCGRKFSWQSFCQEHKLKHFRRDVHNNCFCPVCDEGFDTIQTLEMHTIHLHQMTLHTLQGYSTQNLSRITKDEAAHSKETLDSRGPRAETVGRVSRKEECETAEELRYNRFNENNTPEDSSNSLDDHAMCNICNMVFLHKRILKVHQEKFHLMRGDESTTQRPDSIASKQNRGDRFYVLLSDHIYPQAVHGMDKGIDDSDKTLGLTSSLYRYDTSSRCDECNLTFISKDMLTDHREKLHKARRNFVFVNANVDTQKRSPQENALVKPTNTAQLHKTSSTRVEFRSPTSVPSQPEAVAPQRRFIVCKRPVNVPKTSKKPFHSYFHHRCKICNLIFFDKRLLRIHKENVHGLKTAGDEPSNSGSSRSASTATKSFWRRIVETENKRVSATQLVTRRDKFFTNLKSIEIGGTVETENKKVSATQLINQRDKFFSNLKPVVIGGNVETENKKLSATQLVTQRDKLFSNLKPVVIGGTVETENKKVSVTQLVTQRDKLFSNLKPVVIGGNVETENKKLSATQLVTQRDKFFSILKPVSLPEEIRISDDETADKSKSSSATKIPESGASKTINTPPRVRLVSLPPGNYKISKLKIRSADTAVGKLVRNLKCGEKSVKVVVYAPDGSGSKV